MMSPALPFVPARPYLLPHPRVIEAVNKARQGIEEIAREPTLGDLRRAVAGRLAPALAGIVHATPDIDARILVAHAAGVDSSELVLHAHKRTEGGVEAAAFAFAARRISGEPVARIVGHKEFYGLDLVITPETLVPRADTETVVDAALAFVRQHRAADATIRVADLGTGSGAILLALLSELSNAVGVGVDISQDAIATARTNADRLGLAKRATFVVGDWGAPVRGPVDVIVANPPYIETTAIAGLDREVRDHDPARALDGGTDGLDAIRRVVAGLGNVLAMDGAALVEIGIGQRESVADMARAGGFGATFARDLGGVDRVAILVRPSAFGVG